MYPWWTLKIVKKGAVILFRSVEYSGISSIQFPEFRPVILYWFSGIPTNPGIESHFHKFKWFRLQPIPGIPGIPSNSGLIQFLEFRTGIAKKFWKMISEHITQHVGESDKDFPNGIPGIGWKRNRMYSLKSYINIYGDCKTLCIYIVASY